MRFDLDTFKEISDTLTRNKSRSILTGFGVFWGLFMLLFMLGGGKGFKQKMAANFEGFATNTTIIFAEKTTKPYKGFKEGRWWNLDLDDVERLRLMIPELEVISPTLSAWGDVATKDEFKYEDTVLKGVNSDYNAIEKPTLKYGRFINDMDVQQERKVCMIGKSVYENLFPEGGNPCGQYIKVGAIYYQVIGVDISSGNLSINGSADQCVCIPFPVAQKIYHRGKDVDLICMTGKDGVKMSTLTDRIREVVGPPHFVDPEDTTSIMLIDTEELFNMVDTLFKGLNLLIWLVGLGTILAGAIGVSNIMMVTVKERTTEIGIRRAIGACPKDILSQIMMESITLTTLAGLLSIVFTVFVLNIMEKASTDGTTYQIGFWAAIMALVMLAVLGVLAGLAPSSRAMAIKPVDAMRDE